MDQTCPVQLKAFAFFSYLLLPPTACYPLASVMIASVNRVSGFTLGFEVMSPFLETSKGLFPSVSDYSVFALPLSPQNNSFLVSVSGTEGLLPDNHMSTFLRSMPSFETTVQDNFLPQPHSSIKDYMTNEQSNYTRTQNRASFHSSALHTVAVMTRSHHTIGGSEKGERIT